MNINDRQDEVIRELAALDDWFATYDHLIALGETLEPLGDGLRTQQNMIDGCQSQVWVAAKERDGVVHFFADSDARITKGMVALLLSVVNDRPAEEIAAADLYFLQRTGLVANLSPARANGLASVVARVKEIAANGVTSA